VKVQIDLFNGVYILRIHNIIFIDVKLA